MSSVVEAQADTALESGDLCVFLGQNRVRRFRQGDRRVQGVALGRAHKNDLTLVRVVS